LRRACLRLAVATLAVAVVAVPADAVGGDAAGRSQEVAIFYYPWYSNPARDGRWAHWYVERNGSPVLATPYYPRRGLYSSSSPRIVEAHMAEIRTAGVDTVVVSWWGTSSPEADRLALVREAARRHRLNVAIHLEPYAGRTPTRAAQDIARLRADGYADFYVYDAEREPAREWAEALGTLDEGVRVFGHTALVGRAKASGFHGLYTYDVLTWRGRTFRRLCRQARAVGLLCAPSVGPGFDARLATSLDEVRPRLHGATYDAMWRHALAAQADLVTITSYNEWQEGTQIEPARLQAGRPAYDGAWGRVGGPAERAYLDATARWTAAFRAGVAG
jgi:glycoprotein endo-alpha-1,2-mannosidase